MSQSVVTVHVGADGQRIYPCRCGATHEGTYAAEDFAHHDCLHDYTLVWLGEVKVDADVMCPGCGAMWQVRRG